MVSKRKCLLGAAVVAFTALTAPAAGAEEIIAGVRIDGLHQNDGNGLYDRIINAALKASGSAVKLKVSAPNRAFNDFDTGKVACISPSNKNPEFYISPFDTVVSKPMFTAKVYIFTPEGSSPVSDLGALAGKKVGTRVGMTYGTSVGAAKLNLVEAKTIEANIKKLKAGRIDAFLGYYPDTHTVFDELGMQPLPHAVDNPVVEHPDSVLCRTDQGGGAIVDAFNAGYDAISANGELEKIEAE